MSRPGCRDCGLVFPGAHVHELCAVCTGKRLAERWVRDVVEELLPGGQYEQGDREYRYGSGRGLVIAIGGPKSGLWCDHTAGEGGDLIALIARCIGDDRRAALAWARRWLGQPERRRPARPLPVHAPEDEAKTRKIAERMFCEAAPLCRGDMVSRYLAGREIDLERLARANDGKLPKSLRFHPSLWNRESGRAWPAELRVFWERPDSLRPGRYTCDRFTFADFYKMHQNRRLTKEVADPKRPGKTKDLTQSIAIWWLNDPRRREHLAGVVFDPTEEVSRDHWNLWRGFGVQPRRGSWRLLRQHLFEVVCSREQRDFRYLLDTMARLFKHPALPAEVAVVMKGDEGCGKGILGRALYRIMGQHGLHISHPEHLRGKHNAHLRDCVYLFADEAFYAGDKQHESILKAIITENTLAIEPKNKNLIDVPNYLHMWMASNLDCVVPASLRARRWFIPKVSDHRIGDREYFAAIYREIAEGGLEAMLFDLLHRDISQFDPRTVPLTGPLAIQKLHLVDGLFGAGFYLGQPVWCPVVSGVVRVLHDGIIDEILSAMV
jgi:hypothetical protein